MHTYNISHWYTSKLSKSRTGLSVAAFIQAVSRIAPKESDGEETQNKLKLRTFDFGGCTPMYIHTTYICYAEQKYKDKKINKAQ